VDLDEVADELYDVPPEEFIALRTDRQDAAKADGDKALAKEIGALPKPSAAAWVCNLLVREHREEIENLVELGTLLREAQENLAGDQLRALDVQRRQLVSALTRQARALANDRGHPVSTAVATQVEDTLRAAMSDPDAGDALLSGRLTSPMSYSGMGTTVTRPALTLVKPARPEAPPKPARQKSPEPSGETAADRRRREQEERRRAAEEKRERELAAARAATEEASATVEEASAALEEHRRQARELAARHAELQSRVDELADQLAAAERETAEAASTLKREERRRTAAEHEVAEAIEARDRALARVAQLEQDRH
jgi:DNA repair exonuclease SbcCD ATPase subunit